MSEIVAYLIGIWAVVAVFPTVLAAVSMESFPNWRAWWIVAAILWPVTLLALAARAVHRDVFSEEARLQRRIAAAERARTLTEMRRKAELAEADARRAFDSYITSEAP